tara:strand:+ start:3726 stop:4016 length:291 start_codon:yes stop_codon:yes gene_type:complete
MRDGCREPGSHEREIFEMMLRKDRFLAAMFALSLGACGGDAEVEEAEVETTEGDEDPMMDTTTDDTMVDDTTMDDGMDDTMDDGMDDGVEEGPLPE